MRLHRPIFVTGCPRSGTSMMAGILQLSGCPGGVMNKMFENIAIRDSISKSYLLRLGIDLEGQYPLEKKANLRLPSMEARVLHILKRQNVTDITWFYKDSRLLLAWEYWNAMFPGARWIIVQREEADVLTSCEKTGWMSAYKRRDVLEKLGYQTATEGWKYWYAFYQNKIEEVLNTCPFVRVICLDKLLDGDYTELQILLADVGLTWNQETTKEFIELKLWKSIKKRSEQ